MYDVFLAPRAERKNPRSVLHQVFGVPHRPCQRPAVGVKIRPQRFGALQETVPRLLHLTGKLFRKLHWLVIPAVRVLRMFYVKTDRASKKDTPQ
jgi:hypothetical protein